MLVSAQQQVYGRFPGPDSPGQDAPSRGTATSASVAEGGGPRSSRFKGVRFRGFREGMSKWQVEIRAHGKNRCLGTFDDEEEAARVFDRAAFYLRGRWATTGLILMYLSLTSSTHPRDAELNFPAAGPQSVPTAEQIAKLSEQPRPSTRGGSAIAAKGRPRGAAGPRSCRFTGVCRGKSSKWLVNIRAHGTTRHLGAFDDEEEAARMFDRAAFFLRGRWATFLDSSCTVRMLPPQHVPLQGRQAQLPGGRRPERADR